MTRSSFGVAALVLVAACTSSRAEVPTTTAVPAATTTSAPATTSPPLEVATTTNTIVLDPVTHSYPISADVNSSYARTHGQYPATDVFAACGSEILAMATGTVSEIRTVDTYEKATDNPALRGGMSVAVIGDDGMRYYASHFGDVTVTRGTRVMAGQALGIIGLTGDSTACHTHIGLSPTCAGIEWSVRRGVIWPWPYLDDWRRGGSKSPVGEIAVWAAAHPTACADAMADPFAPDAG